MSDRVRLWFQWFCGVLSHEKADQSRHAEMLLRMQSYAGDNNERWLIVQQSLAQIEQQLRVQHIPRRPPNPAEYDWEQVQAQELAEMLANTPKENN